MINFRGIVLINQGKSKWIKAVLLVLACDSSFSQVPTGAPWVGEDLQGIKCEGKISGAVSYDYLERSVHSDVLRTVERRHFTPRVEQLIGGETTSDLVADLDYTLNYWPNHHRALHSVIRYQLLKSKDTKKFNHIPAECYLQRAANFSPNDPTVRMLYGIYLHRLGLYERAQDEYLAAENMNPLDVQLKYNLGLLLVDMGKPEEAKSYAEYIYAKGFPLPGLKNKLAAKGYWEAEGEK